MGQLSDSIANASKMAEAISAAQLLFLTLLITLPSDTIIKGTGQPRTICSLLFPYSCT